MVFDWLKRKKPADPLVNKPIEIPTKPAPKTISYQLESKSKISVNVPEHYGDLAERLINHLISDQNSRGLYQTFPFIDEPGNEDILRAAINFTQYKLKPDQVPSLRDKLYLTIASCGARKEGLTDLQNNIEAVLKGLETTQEYF